MLKTLSQKAQRVGFWLLCIPILAAPWFFGSWEMWWFWPFAALVFAAAIPLGARTILDGIPKHRHPRGSRSRQISNPVRLILLASYLPFMIYAGLWFLNAEVTMDAERSFQLFLTALLIGTHTIYGLERDDIRRLHLFLCVDLLLLALYGVVNHALTHSTKVMWAVAFPQYVSEHRASGSYYCPDHFAGLMEIGIALALGLIFDRTRRTPHRLLGGLLCAFGVWGVIISKSRGGGLVLVLLAALLLAWGFAQWQPRVRWAWRAGCGAVAALLLILFATSSSAYMQRFLDESHFDAKNMRGKSAGQALPELAARLKGSCRGQMYSAAYRAWKTSPFLGIGPGMHQNLWPHFAASPDGNRAQGQWPSHINNHFFSYEVHSDWLQLLEEYGLFGLILFLPFIGLAATLLIRGVRNEALTTQQEAAPPDTGRDFAILLGGLLAGSAMAFHSLGDFNLQIPATTWLLAFVVAAALRVATAPSDTTPSQPRIPPPPYSA